MSQIELITLSGPDQGGVTAGITGILAGHDVNILDIGQAVIHATLSIGVLVEVPDAAHSRQIRDDLQAFADSRGLAARFSGVSADSYAEWISAQGRARYIVTLLARKITADQLSRVTAVVHGFDQNIDGINRMYGRIPLCELPQRSNACVEF